MLLLDSQVVLWVSTDNPRLGRKTRARIASSSEVYVSAASVFELTIKSMLGKLRLPADFVESVPAQGFIPLPIEHEDAAGVTVFPELFRHDPLDRLVLSQAKRGGLTLLTADSVLLSLGLDFVVDARE
jgi:PIN domain nuclease of toxin-antitoxin system